MLGNNSNISVIDNSSTRIKIMLRVALRIEEEKNDDDHDDDHESI